MPQNFRSVVLVAVSLVALSACHHPVAPVVTPTPQTAPPAPTVQRSRPPAAAATVPPAPRETALSEDEIFRRKSLDALNAEHPLGDVFFQYDQSELSADARAVLQRDAAWLSKWPQTRVSVDGHCDERGTEEYNLALGEQRAEAVKMYLTGLGVSADRLVTRSFGKEDPFCRATGESCWSQNRRGHFLITAK